MHDMPIYYPPIKTLEADPVWLAAFGIVVIIATIWLLSGGKHDDQG
jgi:hypothetical protein